MLRLKHTVFERQAITYLAVHDHHVLQSIIKYYRNVCSKYLFKTIYCNHNKIIIIAMK